MGRAPHVTSPAREARPWLGTVRSGPVLSAPPPLVPPLDTAFPSGSRQQRCPPQPCLSPSTGLRPGPAPVRLWLGTAASLCCKLAGHGDGPGARAALASPRHTRPHGEGTGEEPSSARAAPSQGRLLAEPGGIRHGGAR